MPFQAVDTPQPMYYAHYKEYSNLSKMNASQVKVYVNIAPAGRSLNFFLQLFSSLRYAGYLLREPGLLANLTWISKGKPRPPELAIGSYVNSTPSGSAINLFSGVLITS